ncbi:hypothetical protein BCR41DRAFT_397361 [Lobosporangium transversale]|uniref:Uncharacterized protein n=1 Tax=Lobosporangium transversale TaxID=64571 RepID=A0A1Y2GJN1_9FUNG|nr:hypothetical protein BCR41DRAFT_397361 [Lobosporangium transversale]ORZ12938.1 hypothetical protein BCR41DRAFT_397361 [Lobosporangium transversale]|eukprot:XP_021880287.1 hypothetical protein BCR41DRAFT_397361 [Lobosporangium transversale]
MVDHLRGADKAWRIVDLDDYFRNKRDWVDPQQSFSSNGGPLASLTDSTTQMTIVAYL